MTASFLYSDFVIRASFVIHSSFDICPFVILCRFRVNGAIIVNSWSKQRLKKMLTLFQHLT